MSNFSNLFPYYANLNYASYNALRNTMVERAENPALLANDPSAGEYNFNGQEPYTIGYGYDISQQTNGNRILADFAAAGISLNSTITDLLENYRIGNRTTTLSELDTAFADAFGEGNGLTQSQADALVNAIAPRYESFVVNTVNANDAQQGGFTLGDNGLHAMLFSEDYNAGVVFGATQAIDIADDNVTDFLKDVMFFNNTSKGTYNQGLENRRISDLATAIGVVAIPENTDGNTVVSEINFNKNFYASLDIAQAIAQNTTAINSHITTLEAGNSAADNLATLETNLLSESDNSLLALGYYVPQPADIGGTNDETWNNIATKANSTNSITIPGTSGDPGLTLANINAVFSDSNLSAGGLVHVPVAVSSVASSNTPLPFLSNQAYVFDPATDSVYTVGDSLDNHDRGALIIDTTVPGITGFPTFDQGTYSGISYNASTNTIGVSLVALDDTPVGTFNINTTTGDATVTLPTGATITPTGITNLHITLPELVGTTPAQTLVSYLGDVGYTTSIGAMDTADFSFLYPSGLPSQGTTLNLNSHSGVVSSSEFSAFTDISGVGTITAADSGVFDLASAPVTSDPLTGTHIDLVATDWNGTTLIGNNENGQSLTASLFGDDTLTAGNGTGDSLTAGEGVDTLTGGTGGDTFWALSGLASGSSVTGNGTGGNTLIASGDISQASVSGVTSLQVGAVLTGANNITLTADQLNGFTTINASETGTTVNVSTAGILDLTSDTFTNPANTTINASASGNVSITRTESSTDSAIALSASGSGNDTLTLGDASGDNLSASGGGNDTLTVGNGGGDSINITGKGNDTITAGTGIGDTITVSGNGNNSISAGVGDSDFVTVTGSGTNTVTLGSGNFDVLTVSNGTDTATAGTGTDDQLTATTGGNTLIAGNGAGDIFTAQGGDNVMQAGNGGSTFNISDDDNSATATGGNNTFNLMGASGLTDVSGTTIDLAGSVIDGGAGGTNTINAAGGTTLIMSDDDGSISHIQSVTGMSTLDINADQLTPLASLSFGGGSFNTLDAESSGTYNLAALDTADTVKMVDASTGGPVTLINNDADGAEVIGSNSGDVLTVGGGAGDTIIALFGSGDTITAGAGDGDTISAFGTGDTVTASGDDAHVTLTSSGSATLSGAGDTVTEIGAGETIALSGTGGSVDDIVGNGNTFVVGGGASEAGASITGKNDLYEFVSDFGTDSVTINGGSANAGHIIFGSGITTQNLWFAQTGNDLTIDLMGTDESVTVSGWFNGSGHQAHDVLAGGSQLTNAQVAGLVSAMATYQAANPGFDPTSVSTLPSDTTLQGAVTTAWGTPGTITDTAANIAGELDYLETLAAASELTSITITDPSTPLPVTLAQLTSDATALGLISGSYSLAVSGVSAAGAATVAADAHVTSVSVSDSAANVTADLAALQTLAGAGSLGFILLTDTATPTLTVTETQLASDAGALGDIVGSYNLAVTNVLAADAVTIAAESHVISVAVTDSPANVTAHIAALETLAASGELASIALTGTSPALTFDAADASADADALSLLTGTYTLTVSDSAANVASNIDALGTLAAIGAITAITLTNSGTPTLSITQAQAANDAAALGLITTPFAVTLGSDTAAAFNSAGDDVTLTGSGNVVTANGSNTEVYDGSTGGNTITLAGNDDSADLIGTGDTVIATGTGIGINDWAGGNNITLGSSDIATLYGVGSTVTVLGGGGSTVNDYGYMGGDATTLDGATGVAILCNVGSSVVMNGTEDTAWLYSNYETATVNSTYGMVHIESNDNAVNVTSTGIGNEIDDQSTGSNTITLGGIGNNADLGGTGDTVTLTGIYDNVSAWAGDNTITLGDVDYASLYSSGNTATMAGSGDVLYDFGSGGSGGNTLTISGASGAAVLYDTGSSVTMSGNADMAYLYSNSDSATANGTNGTLTIGSSGDTITLAGNENTATDSGSGNSVSLTGTNAQLDITGSNDDTISFGSAATGTVLLESAASFAGTVAGLASGDSIDLGDFLLSGSPTISSVTGTGATGTATTITITDGAASTQLALLNQFANQFAVSTSAYTLAADSTASSAGTLFQLAAGH